MRNSRQNPEQKTKKKQKTEDRKRNQQRAEVKKIPIMAPVRKQKPAAKESAKKTGVKPQTDQGSAQRRIVKLQIASLNDAPGKTLADVFVPRDPRVPGYKNDVEKNEQTKLSKQDRQYDKKEKQLVTTEMHIKTSTVNVYGNSTSTIDLTTTVTTPMTENISQFLVENATFLFVSIFLISVMAFARCCCCGLFIRIKRWIIRIFPRRRVVRREKERISGIDESEGESQRLLNNEISYSSHQNFSNVVSNSLRRRNNENYENEQAIKQKEDLEFQKTLMEYENSFKPTEEEVQYNKNKDEEYKKLQQETKEMRMNIEKMKEEHESPNSSFTGNFAEVDKVDNEFREKLDEQNRIFDEKMRRVREKREEKERKNQEEFEKLRYESEQNVAAFLKFIQLRLRFEEKEQEWSDSLQKLRKPLVSVVTSYYYLQEEVRNWDFSDEFSVAGVRSEGQLFANKVSTAQNMLKLGFDSLEKLVMEFDDRIFIRMIMKSISLQGLICNEVGIHLVRVMQSVDQKEELKQLDIAVSKLNPHSIPTTSMLKRTSPSARMEDYLNIDRVPTPGWLRYFK